MFCVPPEVAAAQYRLQQQFRDSCVAAAPNCSRVVPLLSPFATSSSYQTSAQPSSGIASISGSGCAEKQTAGATSNLANGGANGSKGDRYKTELCRTYEESGTCRYGDKCQFAHGFAELRNVARHPKYKTDLCRTFHTSGFCPYGARCHFIHGEQEKPQQHPATGMSSPLLRQQHAPVARRPEVLDLLDAGRQNELSTFVNTVTSLLNLNSQNQQQSQQQPVLVREAAISPFQTRTSQSKLSDMATYELLRLMIEQQLSLEQSKSLLSPCPSPTSSQYGSVCSSGSNDDIPSPVCSPSSSLSSLPSTYGNWNAFCKQQASFDSLSSYSSSSNRRTPPGSPESPTMHYWHDRNFRLWPSVDSVDCSSYEDLLSAGQSAVLTKSKSDLLISSRAVRSIFQ